jgi:hypothetical protein
MHTIDHKQLVSFLSEVAFDLDQPVMVWGQPGVGKSDAVRQMAEGKGAVLVDIRLSQYDSVDLRGIPSVESGLTRWNMPATLPFVGNPDFPTDRPIVVFFDEINGAAPAVAGVAYQLVLDRAAGEHKLLPNVRIVAAGNREGDKGVTNKMPLPLANRFAHVELGVSSDALVSHMLDKGMAPECVAFMSFRKNLVTTFDPSRPDKAFATPRSWMRAFQTYMSGVSEMSKKIAMSGFVGEGPALEFWAFIDSMSKVIPVSTILADPKGAPLPEELSMRYATAVSVSGSMSVKTAGPLHTYLKRMDPEFLILAWQLALKRDETILGTPEFVELASKYRDLFRR